MEKITLIDIEKDLKDFLKNNMEEAIKTKEEWAELSYVVDLYLSKSNLLKTKKDFCKVGMENYVDLHEKGYILPVRCEWYDEINIEREARISLEDYVENIIRNTIIEHQSKNVKIINLTPHDVNIVDSQGEVVKIYERQDVVLPRVTQANNFIKDIDGGIEVFKTELKEVENIPAEKSGTYLIVSLMVAQALSSRKDLLVPNSGEAVRDDKGNIIGVPNFLTI